MPPVQENSPAAVAITFSDRGSKEISIVPPVERILQRREAMNEKGLVRPVITRWLEEGVGKTSTGLASPLGRTDHVAQW
jgi:hypothetical protein